MAKKSLLWFVKCIAAGCVALIIACIFSFFYYNTGRHTDNPSGATDYLWEGEHLYLQLREGFGIGITDGDGFNNSYPGVTSDADILIIGSSHMEAAQVSQNRTTVYRLNELLEESSSGLTAYNIGVSAHNLYRCAGNLQAALDTYAPKYAVIETDSIQLLDASAQQVLDGTLEKVTSYDGLLYDIQAVPLPKLLMQQLREYQWGRLRSGDTGSWNEFTELLSSCKNEETATPQTPVSDDDAPLFGQPIWQMFEQMSSTAQERGVQLIIVYHPTLSISRDGTAYVNANSKERTEFAQLCSENGITLIDMSDIFLEAYSEEHVLPHGFSNSAIGYGHLNTHGHRMIAEALCQVIIEKQGAKE